MTLDVTLDNLPLPKPHPFPAKYTAEQLRAAQRDALRFAEKICVQLSMGDYHQGLRADGAAMCAREISRFAGQMEGQRDMNAQDRYAHRRLIGLAAEMARGEGLPHLEDHNLPRMSRAGRRYLAEQLSKAEETARSWASQVRHVANTL